MEKIKSNYLYIKGKIQSNKDSIIKNLINISNNIFKNLVLEIRNSHNFPNNITKLKNSKKFLNKDSLKIILDFFIRNIENNIRTNLNNDSFSFELKEDRYISKDPLYIIIYEKPISMIKEYLEISLILDNIQNMKKENFVILKSFSELKTEGLTNDIWQIKNFNLHVLYEFKCNVLIESPKKQFKNRIPLPISDINKRKIAKHDSQVLDCDSKKLRKLSSSKKNNESDDEKDTGKNDINSSLNRSNPKSNRDSTSITNRGNYKDEKQSLADENTNIRSIAFKTNNNPFIKNIENIHLSQTKIFSNSKEKDTSKLDNLNINRDINKSIQELNLNGKHLTKSDISSNISFESNKNQGKDISFKNNGNISDNSKDINNFNNFDFSFKGTFNKDKTNSTSKFNSTDTNNKNNDSVNLNNDISNSFANYNNIQIDKNIETHNNLEYLNNIQRKATGNPNPNSSFNHMNRNEFQNNSNKELSFLDIGQILSSSKGYEDDKFYKLENLNNLDNLRLNPSNSDKSQYAEKTCNPHSLRDNLNDKRFVLNSSKTINFVNSPTSELNDKKINKIKYTLHSQNTILTNQSNSQNNNTIFSSNNVTHFSVLEHDEIDINKFDRNEYGESFCDAFFHAGLFPKKAKMIPDSENFIPPCKHKNCGILNAYRPEIINCFPSSIIDGIEINSTTASLSFPYGIKLCYCDKETDLKPINPFSTIITNEAGEQRYLTIVQFYQKFDSSEFEQLYNFNPIKDFFKMTKNIELMENTKTESQRKSVENKLKKNLEICTNFINNSDIYLPHAICLISKFPTIKQMEMSLESLLKLFTDKNSSQKDINNLLIHIINEISLPPPNKKLNFYLPYSLNQIELYSYIHKDLPYDSFNLNKILEYFSSENFTLIIFLILFEQKILFVCDNYGLLSEILLSFISLIYPFEYVNILIPILSEELVKYLQCFRPFIMGIDECMLETAKTYIEEEQTVYLIHIKRDLVEIYMNKKLKKATKKSVCADKEEGKIPNIPDEMYNELKKEIGNLKNLFEKNKKNKKNKNEQNKKIQIKLRKYVMKLIAFIFGDYKKYLTYIDKIPIFNLKSFVDSKPNNNSHFYEEICSTHIFKYFLQVSTQETFSYFEKLCIRYSNRGGVGSTNSNKDKNSNKSRKSIFFLNRKCDITDENKLDYSRSSSQHIKNTKREITGDKDRNFVVNNDTFLKNNQNLILYNQNNNTNSGIDISAGIGNANSNLKSANISAVKSQLTNDSSIRRLSDSNSYSNSKSDNTDNYKNGENENYMILPYFINSLLNSEISKIEFFINEKIKNLTAEDLKIFETKILPYREGKILTVTESPEIIVRYKFNNYERTTLFSNLNSQNSKCLNSPSPFGVEQPKILLSLEEKYSNLNYFDSNFQSNYPTEHEKRGSFGRETNFPNNNEENQIEKNPKSSNLSNPNINEEIKDALRLSCGLERESNPLRNSFLRRSSRRVSKSELEIRKEKINDFLRSIYSSEPINTEDKKFFDELFSSRTIRGYFAQLIFQEKFKQEKTHVINCNVFNDFYQMIFTALLKCDNNISQFEIVRLLTKSSFYYYKILNNKQRYYIYQEIAKKQGFFSCWQNEEFWSYWFNCEIKGKTNTFSNWEEFYFTILIEISSKMKDLNITYKIINYTLIENLAEKFLGNRTDLIKELELITTKQLKSR